MNLLTRRRLLGAAVAGTGVLAMARPGKEQSDTAPVVRMLCWPGYDDAEVLAAFTRATGARVEATLIGANDEIFTFLRAGGIGRYDIVTPHNGIVRALAEAGLLQPVALEKIPNTADLYPRFQVPEWVRSADQVWGVPFLWGTSPMVYNVDHFPEPPDSWSVVKSRSVRRKVAMTEDGLGHLILWNTVAGYADPTRVTLSQLNATTEMLIAIKRDQAVAFVPSVKELAAVIASGKAWVSTIGWESAPVLAPTNGDRVRITHPAPGDYSFCDNLCIPAEAPHVDLAHALINHFLAPESQAALMSRLLRGTVSRAAVPLLSETARGLYDYDDLDAVFAVSPLRGFPPLTDEDNGIATYVDWVKAWERVRFTVMAATGTTS